MVGGEHMQYTLDELERFLVARKFGTVAKDHIIKRAVSVVSKNRTFTESDLHTIILSQAERLAFQEFATRRAAEAAPDPN